MLYSAAGGNFSPFADTHLLRFAITMVMALIIASMPRDFVKLMAYPGYIIVLLLLVAVEAAGSLGGGSQRWLEVGPIRIQPSELMKPAVALALAWTLSQTAAQGREELRGYLRGEAGIEQLTRHPQRSPLPHRRGVPHPRSYR